MIIGRAFFATGTENSMSAKAGMISKWFDTKELAFSMGVTLCASRLGSSISSYIGPIVYEWNNLPADPFLLAFYLNVLSLFFVFLLVGLDAYTDRRDH